MNEEKIEFDKYEKYYSEENFWDKVKKFAVKAGAKAIYLALKLYYALTDDDTPAWAKSTIVGALGYFILPIDLIPDAIPVVGFSDDMAIMSAALLIVAKSITPKVKDRARKKMLDWFGTNALEKVED